MTACRILGANRGLTEEALCRIDDMHIQNEELIRQFLKNNTPEHIAVEMLTAADYDLQLMWGFPMDRAFHTLPKQYLFRKAWYGRKFRCNDTGEEFEIPIDVYETAYYGVGNGGIDVGRYRAYHRIIGNVVEVAKSV